MPELTAHLHAQDAAIFLLMCIGIIWFSVWRDMRREK